MPSTVFQSDPYNVNGQRCLDYTQDGTLWTSLSDPTSDSIKFFRSVDGGVNWTEITSMALTPASHNLNHELHSMFIDKDNFIHAVIIVSAGGTERQYLRGVPNDPVSPTDYTWGPGIQLNTLGPFSGMEVVAHRKVAGDGDGWTAWCVSSDFDGSQTKCQLHRVDIALDGTYVKAATFTIKFYGVNTTNNCSIDFRHEQNDQKVVQSSLPHLYVVYGEGGGALFFRKVIYTPGSPGTWSMSTERTIDASGQFFNQGCASYYDGTRVVMVSQRSGPSGIVKCWERDEADTTTTARDPTALADGAINAVSCGYGPDQDIWIGASGDTSDDVKKIRFNRGAGTWAGSWTLVESITGDASGLRISINRGIVPGGPLGMVYVDPTPTPNLNRFTSMVAAWEVGATLQGVGSVSPAGSLGFSGEARLQGVAAMSSLANIAFSPNALLQGVATLGAGGLLVPRLDFTVFDGYIVDPFDTSYIPLIYHDTEQTPKRTGAVRLRPPRQDTGLGPTEVRPESGEIFSQQDFSHGAGQLYYHHEGRDVRKYLWSEGFDLDIDTIGEPAILHHLHNIPASPVTSTLIGQIEVFNDLPFVIDGTKVKRGSGDFPGVWTDEDPSGAEADVTVNRIVSSGEYLYAALGSGGIHRRDTTGAWTHWSDVLATQIAWVKNRIMASDGTKIYEVISAGVAPSALETLPAGWTFERIFEAGGFIYAIAISSSSGLSRIHTYGENDAGTGLEKKNETPFPRDQLIRSGRGYLGAVYIGGGIKTAAGGYDPVVYQAFPQDDGSLTYAKVAEGEGAGGQDLSVLEFEPIGEDVLFGWSLGSGAAFGARDGLAIHKLAVGAFLPHLKKNGAGAGRQVVGLAFYKGRILFSLKGDGLYYEDTTKLVQEAELVSSVADWQTTAKKTWDLIQVSHAPLPANTVVRVDTTTKLPSVGEWTQRLVSSVAGEEVVEVRVPELEGRTLAIRLRSTANPGQTESPEGVGFFVRSNLLPDNPEFGLGRVLRILDEDQKDERAETVYQDVEAIRRKLHFMAHRWVTLHEPGVTWSVRVEDVQEIEPTGPIFQETEGETERQGYLIQLSLAGTRD